MQPGSTAGLTPSAGVTDLCDVMFDGSRLVAVEGNIPHRGTPVW
jgi:hypothetical protein